MKARAPLRHHYRFQLVFMLGVLCLCMPHAWASESSASESSALDAWLKQSHHMPVPQPVSVASASPTVSSSTKEDSRFSGTANDVLMLAISLVGTPYQWGGNTPESGFDCSGLVKYVFSKAMQTSLPRTSKAMSGIKNSQKIRSSSQLSPGDLIFFATGKRGINHVGIYVGKQRFVHAPNKGGTVRLDSLTTRYWKQRYQYGRRIRS